MRVVSCLLSAVLVALSPGLGAYDALAAMVRTAPVQGGLRGPASPVRLPAGISRGSLGGPLASETFSPGLSGTLAAPSLISPKASAAPAVSPSVAAEGPGRGPAAAALPARAPAISAAAVSMDGPSVSAAGPRRAAALHASASSQGAQDRGAAAAAAVGPGALGSVLSKPESSRGRAKSSPASAAASVSARVLGSTAAELKNGTGWSGRLSALGALFSGSRTRRSEAAVVSGRSPARRPGLRRSAGMGSYESPVILSVVDLESGRQITYAPEEERKELTPEVRRGIVGLFIDRAVGMIAFTLSSMAYPLLLIESVGHAQMFTLFSLGGILSMGIALLAGKVADKLPLKQYMLFNTLLRSGLSLAMAGFYVMGWLNFWTLFGLTIVSGWQFSTLFITGPAMMAELVGKNRYKIRSAEALMRVATIVVSVLSGLFLGEHIVDAVGLAWTFVIVAGIYSISFFILAKTLPNIKRKVASGAARVSEGLTRLRDRLRAFPWRTYGLNAALLLAGIGTFLFVWRSPVPIVAAMAPILLRSKIYKNVISKHKLLKMALILVVAITVVEVPLRNAVLGALAQETVGAAGKAAFLGRLLASFYMGQLPSVTGMLDPKMGGTIGRIGPWKLKKPLKVSFKGVMKYAGAAGLAVWVNLALLPTGWPALVLGAMGVSLALPAWAFTGLGWAMAGSAAAFLYAKVHNVIPRISERNWLRLEALGLLAMGVPLMFWGSPAALFLSLFFFGMVHSPAAGTIHANYSSQALTHDRKNFQYLIGVKGSFLNMANSVAYAIYGLAKTLPERMYGESAAFPFTWYVVAGLNALIAIGFLIGSFIVPFKKDLPKK